MSSFFDWAEKVMSNNLEVMAIDFTTIFTVSLSLMSLVLVFVGRNSQTSSFTLGTLKLLMFFGTRYLSNIFSSSSFFMASPSRAVCTAIATLSEMSSPLSSFSIKQEEMPSKTEVSVDITGGENIALFRELNPSWESCSSSVSLSDIACGWSRGGGDWHSTGRDGPGSNWFGPC